MLAHSRELHDQLLQTFSDSHAPHRHGLLLVRVGSKRGGDMDFHCLLLCLFDVQKSVPMQGKPCSLSQNRESWPAGSSGGRLL
jgi:hypothetical protein